MRRNSKVVNVGTIKVGGKNAVSIQSMLNISPEDIDGNINQAVRLKNCGCEIIRVAIPNMESIKLIYAIKNQVDIPLVADIHFDYKLALESVVAGIDKIRINPGNIGDEAKIKAVANACKNAGVPIRIGVNSGSVEKNILDKYGNKTPEALCESALYHASLLEKFDFDDIVLSMKSSDVLTTVNAYKLAASKCDYPLHLGVTEAGTEKLGIVKSSIGIGSLLLDGIGDTIRVSLTANPEKEVECGKSILQAIGLKKNGVEIISCPTCGRTKIDIINITNEVEKKLKCCGKPLKIAIMGCCVNGPGEASDCDVGIAGGEGAGVIFKKGKIVKKVDECNLVNELLRETESM